MTNAPMTNTTEDVGPAARTSAAQASAAADPAAQTMVLTGERTAPGIAEENYWFRRHEIAYTHVLDACAGATVLEAGSGEGYGADMLADVAAEVICVDYDATAVDHARARYPRLVVHRGNLVDLPLPDDSVDTVVNFQVIEHLWDQPLFVRECARVLRPGGALFMSTPNRVTFSPGRDTPLNPFHTRELDPTELRDLLTDNGFEVTSMLGVHHGPALRALDKRWNGSFIDAQINRALAGEPWPVALTADVGSILTSDFEIHPDDIEASLDLLAVAVLR